MSTGGFSAQENKSAEGQVLAIIASRFHGEIVERLVSGAREEFIRLGGAEEDIRTYWVSGAFELPQTASTVLCHGKIDAVVCLGCVIRGETPHFDYVCSSVTNGIGQLAIQQPVPISLGVLTTDTLQQAEERAGGPHGNKGAEATNAVFETLSVYGQIQDSRK